MWKRDKDLARRRRDVCVIQDPPIVPMGVSPTIPPPTPTASLLSNTIASASTNPTTVVSSSGTATVSQPVPAPQPGAISFYATLSSPPDTESDHSSVPSSDIASYANLARLSNDTSSICIPPTPQDTREWFSTSSDSHSS